MYWLINTKFWITNEKMFIKQKSLLVMYIASFLQLWTTNKSKNMQKSKITFSDFYRLINTKFWITNEIMFIKKNYF